MPEFEEISHAGGKILLKPNGFEFLHNNPTPVSLYEIAVTADGRLLDFMPYGSALPAGAILVFMISDRTGFFGRMCPSCNRYFRINNPGRRCTCPYCWQKKHILECMTTNQIEYIEAYIKAFIGACEKGEEVTIDLDDLISKLSNNRSAFVYSDEIQQTRFKCIPCRTTVDVIGKYAACPNCGKHNLLEVFEGRSNVLEKLISTTEATVSDRNERAATWATVVKDSISEWEGIGRKIQAHLAKIPGSPRRKQEVEAINLQNIMSAAESLKAFFGFDIFRDLSESDKSFLNLIVNRRHLLTHCSGHVDQEYIDRTGDSSVRIGQHIRISSSEAKRTLRLFRILTENLVQDYDSIIWE